MPGVYSPNPAQHTLQPMVTGSTVIGIKYKGGVMIAADTLASFGSWARHKNTIRIRKVGNYGLLGATGEISDFQYLGNMLDDLDQDDFLAEDGYSMGPKEYSSYIGRVMYNRRSKMNPLYNQLVVVGKKGSDPALLSYADHQGTQFEEEFIATGFGAHLAMPILRKAFVPDMSFEDTKALVIKCLQVCFYRDCRAYFKITFGYCDGTTTTIEDPIAIDHKWDHENWLAKRLSDTNITATW